MASEVLKSLRCPELLITSGLVAGEWRAPEGETFSVYEPSTGSVLRECANLGMQDFLDAIDSAEKGMAAYHESTTARERGQILRQWYDLVMANIDDCMYTCYKYCPLPLSSGGLKSIDRCEYQQLTFSSGHNLKP